MFIQRLSIFRFEYYNITDPSWSQWLIGDWTVKLVDGVFLTSMSTRPLLKQLSWLLFGILLATTSTSQAQINPCQQSQQLCMNGAICRQAYLNPGYICECQGEWQGQNCEQRFPGITPSIPKECGSNFYSDSGVIVSTNYPLPPNDNEDCYYLVRIPSAESITFYFDAFHSENHKDGLIIYPGTTVNDQLPDLRTFIGTDQIAPQTVNTNQVVLYWYTDFNVPSGGFSIRYEAGKLKNCSL